MHEIQRVIEYLKKHPEIRLDGINYLLSHGEDFTPLSIIMKECDFDIDTVYDGWEGEFKGCTLLFSRIQKKDFLNIVQLITLGANINFVTKYGMNIIDMIFVTYDKQKDIEMLLSIILSYDPPKKINSHIYYMHAEYFTLVSKKIKSFLDQCEKVDYSLSSFKTS